MNLYVNRRIRDKAMVFGLPAERFMMCFAIMVAPVLLVLFVPLLAPVWVLWGVAVYKFSQNMERITKALTYGKQYPARLKNR